jgi:hypothetical protein
MTRAEVDEMLRDHPDSRYLRVWVTLFRRQLERGTQPWRSRRTVEVQELGVTPANVDRLIAAYNALGIGRISVDGEDMTFDPW